MIIYNNLNITNKVLLPVRKIIWYLHCLTTKCSTDKIPVCSHCRWRSARRGRCPSRKKPTTAREEKSKHLGHFHVYAI